ncbi:MAG: cyanophycinase [Bacteroidetes bacterium]|nr:cyanophycinase [Bacteroidota bacterium]
MHLFDNNSYTDSSKKGYLVLIGGAEDRKDNKTILKKVVSLNNAKSAIIIPSASAYPVGLAEDYSHIFKELGVENIFIFDIRDKHEAEDIKYLEKVENADLIFFTGGDQFRLVNTINDTSLFTKIKERYYKGATIAGTSAGAAAACDPIIFDGDTEGLRKGTTSHFKGFGFIKNIIIDTHFVNRGRLGRLTQFLCSGSATKGIGIGEDTAIIIDKNDIFEVIGSEMVIVVNTSAISFSDYKEVKDKDPIVINDIRLGFLQSGSIFSLKEWKVISSNGKIAETIKQVSSLN